MIPEGSLQPGITSKGATALMAARYESIHSVADITAASLKELSDDSLENTPPVYYSFMTFEVL